jgi:hypothetical protein
MNGLSQQEFVTANDLALARALLNVYEDAVEQADDTPEAHAVVEAQDAYDDDDDARSVIERRKALIAARTAECGTRQRQTVVALRQALRLFTGKPTTELAVNYLYDLTAE